MRITRTIWDFWILPLVHPIGSPDAEFVLAGEKRALRPDLERYAAAIGLKNTPFSWAIAAILRALLASY